MNPFYKFINWYFRKESLPYWCIFLIDCIICLLGGIFVCALFFRISRTVINIGPILNTLLLYQVFNVIGFRVFHTYAGVIRYSSFVDLKRVAYAMGLGFVIVAVLHYPIIFWPAIHCSIAFAPHRFDLPCNYYSAVDFPHHDKGYLRYGVRHRTG